MKRVLIYSHDTFGLGNIRRMLEVARHLVESSDEVSVLVITGSAMLHAFRIPPRVDYVKLPCLSRNVEGAYGARNLDLSLSATVRLRANLIRSAVSDFAPDLILVDKKPFGVEDELVGTFAALSGSAKHPKLVLLLRDILDSPATTTKIWRKNAYFEAISAYYDQVLVVGDPEVFDMRREYEFPPFAAAKVQFCGYIARQRGCQDRATIRRDLGLTDSEPLVLLTPGGGEDGYQLVDAYLRGLRELESTQQPRTHIVCGPEMAQAQRQSISQAAETIPRLSVQGFCDDMMSVVAAADLVVSMGGYNTVCELLTCGRRAVVVPRVKPGQEQCIRAQRMATQGLLHMLHPDHLTPGALLTAVHSELAALARHDPLPQLKSLNGLENTTAAILKLITPAASDLSTERSYRARIHTQSTSKEGHSWFANAMTANAH
ncbi:MAG: glycosyltransferase [Burkholderiaceae bacterium]|nr:glycosyltransferase [Burkholderiaceae bacterium]